MACVIAAPSSGSGKTMVSLALSAWAKTKGINIQTFKVGPDYLDPQQLTATSGRPCRNLDLQLSGPEWVRKSFRAFGGAAELTLIEGVMGLFDGIGSTQKASTADLAKSLNLPIVLVIDSRGQAASIAALVKGFFEHDPKLEFAGVILNKINSQRHKQLLEEVLRPIQVKVLGCLPEDQSLRIPSGNLGLSPAHEEQDFKSKIQSWAIFAESYLNMTEFKRLLQSPKPYKNPIPELFINENQITPLRPLSIAVAQDEAFHFRYPETRECLEALGIESIPWKILADELIPKGVHGILIPGGFPEEHAARISQSLNSLSHLKKSFGKIPIYAECGGMLLLGESITDQNGIDHPMANLLPFKAKKGRLKVGYRNIYVSTNGLITRSGDCLIGHEYHRWELTNKASKDKNSSKQLLLPETKILAPAWEVQGWKVPRRKEGWSNKNLHASWIHLHWASCPKIPIRWRSSLEKSV
ncbi:cobyrinate a,c-diamide synthase [Prochlorococcus sp. MIT 1300]|uniref:cobyrinate a,c-diamide synthase n=1 Tax=Prochlorococcus sp. MIT 1300 TaxID=3096218 RepID=UPI002A74F3D4|nr:cobyrinate a,c-diamide synthase [Prochlorococcus sp. MIT 1300]